MAAHSQNTKPQPVVAVAAVMTTLTAISGGLAALEIMPVKVAGLIVLVIAAVNLGVSFYVRNLVVPFVDTAAYFNDKGVLVAGPAVLEVPNGHPVEVEPVIQEPPESPAPFGFGTDVD